MSKSTEELRQKLRNLPRTSNNDPRYPIDAYEDDLVQLFDQELSKDLQEAERFHYDLGYKDGRVECAKRVEEADKAIDEVLKERDSLEERLDSISIAVGKYFGLEVGEHSTANDPWYNAFEMLRDNTLNNQSKQKETRNQLLAELMDEGPKDVSTDGYSRSGGRGPVLHAFNEANSQWRALLKSKEEKA